MVVSGRTGYFLYRSSLFVVFLFFIAGLSIAVAQPVKLSIKETIQKVQSNLPQLEVYRQQAAAEKENISLAKNSLVPELTAGYQVNMATFNNITGMSYPGFLLPISGPPSVGNDLNFIPGTALGALVKWDPFTFGQRNAAIAKATAQYKQANAAYNEQLFQYQYSAVNLYLEALYLKQVNRVSQAVIDRNGVGLEQALVLAKNGLKPGIDTAQFQSIIAQAEIDYLQTERTYQQKLTELTRLTGLTTGYDSIVLTDTVLKQLIITADTASMDNHPYYQSLEAQRRTTEAGLQEIQKAWMPQLDIWGNVYARGSGVNATGVVNKGDGFNLSRTNAGIGVQLSFPVLQYSKVNIRKRQYQFLLKAADARLAQARLDISKQIENAELQYRQDAKIATKTPVQLKVATDVYEGLKLSYEAGLIDYTRLYQSQYELMKAELNQANAQLQLWRSLLSIAVAKGNLDIFLDQFN
jgi:outer membrane protein